MISYFVQFELGIGQIIQAFEKKVLIYFISFYMFYILLHPYIFRPLKQTTREKRKKPSFVNPKLNKHLILITSEPRIISFQNKYPSLFTSLALQLPLPFCLLFCCQFLCVWSWNHFCRHSVKWLRVVFNRFKYDDTSREGSYDWWAIANNTQLVESGGKEVRNFLERKRRNWVKLSGSSIELEQVQ